MKKVQKTKIKSSYFLDKEGAPFRFPFLGGFYGFLAFFLLFLFLGIFFQSLFFPLLLLLFLFPFLSLLFAEVYEQFYQLEDISDAQFYAVTQDKWNIAMHFHNPSKLRKDSYPVILSHGIASNKYCLDLNRNLSLAYFLKQAGYRVFVLSLRGVGKSYHNSPRAYKGFSFDDIVKYDVPAVIQRARELTGASKVSWVGHSMGAMIMQAFLGRYPAGSQDIASFVSLGGPGRLDHIRYAWWGKFSRYYYLKCFFILRSGARLLAPLLSRIHTPFHNIVYSKKNMDERTVKDLLRNSVENIEKGLHSQFREWIYQARELSLDGSFNYRQGFKRIRLPSLFIAGLSDKIAIPESVRFVWKKISSHKKKFVILSKKNGFSMDYCHLGLVLGKEAPREVFPMVLECLEQHARKKKVSIARTRGKS